MRKLKKMLTLLICIVMAVTLIAGCGESKDGKDTGETVKESTTQDKTTDKDVSENEKPLMEKTKVVIYRAGGLKEGESDSIVKEAIEKKLLEDTGTNLDMDVKLLSNEDFVTKVNLAIASGEQIDAIQNYIGGVTDAGVASYIAKPGLIKPLNEYIEKYGSNLKKSIPEISWNSITFNGTTMGIPYYNQQSVFGILVRQDWLDELGIKAPETVADFEKMLEAFKSKDDNIIPLVGRPWEMERLILAGALDCPTYWQFFVDPDDRLLKQGVFHPNYKEVLKYQYRWAKEGLWDIDNRVRPQESLDNLFISGQSGVYMGWNEIGYLIDNIAMKTKAANPEAKFTILPALKGPEGKSGYLTMPAALGAVSVFQKSKNAEYIVKYIDWMLSNKENYDLARHGIEGQDWAAKGQDVWGYPEGKADKFSNEPPYNSRYQVVQNVNVSDRISAQYSEQEIGWIKEVRGFETKADILEGVTLPVVPDWKDKVQEVYDTYTPKCIEPASAALADPYETYDKYIKPLEKDLTGYFEIITKSYNEQVQSKKR